MNKLNDSSEPFDAWIPPLPRALDSVSRTVITLALPNFFARNISSLAVPALAQTPMTQCLRWYLFECSIKDGRGRWWEGARSAGQESSSEPH